MGGVLCPNIDVLADLADALRHARRSLTRHEVQLGRGEPDARRRLVRGGHRPVVHAQIEHQARGLRRGRESGWQPDIADRLPANCPYCVAVGAVAGAQGVPLGSALAAYLQAFASNLIQAAIRLSVIGQSDAVAILAGLERTLAQTAARATSSSLDDLGSATLIAEIAAMNHETQYSRLFRS